jgi:hypothetical protein
MTFQCNTLGMAMDTNSKAMSKSRSGKEQSWIVEAVALVLLVGSGVALRLACHELPNFAPVAAMALFAGYFFRSAGLALLVPLSVMAISDFFLGGYDWAMMALVYSMLALPVAFRGWLRRAFNLGGERTVAPLMGLYSCGLLSSVLFFLVTNFGVWCLWPGPYDRSLAGLAHCYGAAIPFFRYTLAGDMFFAIVLFGSYALAMSLGRARSLATQTS